MALHVYIGFRQNPFIEYLSIEYNVVDGCAIRANSSYIYIFSSKLYSAARISHSVTCSHKIYGLHVAETAVSGPSTVLVCRDNIYISYYIYTSTPCHAHSNLFLVIYIILYQWSHKT